MPQVREFLKDTATATAVKSSLKSVLALYYSLLCEMLGNSPEVEAVKRPPHGKEMLKRNNNNNSIDKKG